MSKKHDYAFPMRMSKELKERVFTAAKRLELSMADWIRIAIIEKLEKEKK